MTRLGARWISSASEGATAGKWKRWGEHPTARFLALAFAVLAAYHGYLYLTGPARMTDRPRARLAEGPATVVEGSTAKLYTVTPANARYVSRHYWIDRIDLAPDDGKD